VRLLRGWLRRIIAHPRRDRHASDGRGASEILAQSSTDRAHPAGACERRDRSRGDRLTPRSLIDYGAFVGLESRFGRKQSLGTSQPDAVSGSATGGLRS